MESSGIEKRGNEGAADRGAVAVLTSGGVDSAVLLAELLRCGRDPVRPIYVQAGLAWEQTELDFLGRFLNAVRSRALAPLVILQLPVADLYGDHWSMTGRGVPDADSADSAVYLPGRNLLLLSKALAWCHLNQMNALALGTLSGNPFPDASARFFSQMESAANEAMGGSVAIIRPFASMTKPEVLECGRTLPLEWTLSCFAPIAGRHCGACNKCAERRQAFKDADVPDPTEYARSG